MDPPWRVLSVRPVVSLSHEEDNTMKKQHPFRPTPLDGLEDRARFGSVLRAFRGFLVASLLSTIFMLPKTYSYPLARSAAQAKNPRGRG